MEQIQERAGRVPFGRRKVVPHACIADGRQHLRSVVAEALQDLGFVTCECAQASALSAVLDAYLPDLFVVGLSAGESAASQMLGTLAANQFGGMVLLLGSGDTPEMARLGEFGEKLGLALLPVLPTGFCSESLRGSVAALLPREVPSPRVDIAEALRAGWLELWYQPKIDARTLAVRSTEALVRMRHPYWGVVQPACFMPDHADPEFQALSEFVIHQAIADWHYFSAERKPIDISINLPISLLSKPDSREYLCRKLPDHPAFAGLIVEVDGVDIVRDLPLARDLAEQLRFQRIVISIDDLGAEWPSLAGLDNFPFVKIKVDRKFVFGCADDSRKQAVCRRIIELAAGYGARTVAEGVETRADFLAVRDMGFDLIQGFLFGKPMTAQKFARTMLRP